MMIWRVWFIGQRDRKGIAWEKDFIENCSEDISADECYDSQNGTLKFMNYVPPEKVEPAQQCGHHMDVERKIRCVRDYGHTGKHMNKLKPKYVKPKMYAVRAFAPGSWTDVELVVK